MKQSDWEREIYLSFLFLLDEDIHLVSSDKYNYIDRNELSGGNERDRFEKARKKIRKIIYEAI